MKNRKAISPLIATVLLIGFAVALAAIVMTWGGGFIRKTTETTETQAETTLLCAKLNLDVSVNCEASEIVIINYNDFKIIDLKIGKRFKDGNYELQEAEEIIEPYKTANIHIDGLGELSEVEIIPTLEGDITCSDSPVSKSIKCTAQIN